MTIRLLWRPSCAGHGSIKKGEKYFGVSYPTIKNRLNTIGDQLEFMDIAPRAMRSEILDRLDKGEITADETIKLLKKGYCDEWRQETDS